MNKSVLVRILTFFGIIGLVFGLNKLLMTLDVESNVAKLERGTKQFNKRQYDKALKTLTSIRAPKFSKNKREDLHIKLAALYYHHGEKEKAIRIMEKAVKQRNHPHFYVELARLLQEMGHKQLAAEILKICLTNFPKAKEAYVLYGVIQGNLEAWDEAISAWKAGKQLDPDDPRFDEYINKALNLKNQLTGA